MELHAQGGGTPKPHYLVVNADEGEPGTHKDRTLMEENPHALRRGLHRRLLRDRRGTSRTSTCATSCTSPEGARLEGAIKEARAKGYLGKTPFGKDFAVEVYVHSGAGAYICGEETSMLNSIEGRRGEPRMKPPFPANARPPSGCPTTVNNLETIAAVPTAPFAMGAEEFSKLSALHSIGDGGVRLYGLNGHVKKPGVVELAVGPTLNELIFDVGGGVLGDRGVLCVIPGGSSTPILRPEETVNAPDAKSPLNPWHGKSVFDVPLGVDTMRGVGTEILGVLRHRDRARAPTRLVHAELDAVAPPRVVRPVHAMSGRQRAWLERVTQKILDGKASMEELGGLHDIANGIMGNTICAFGEGTAMPALAFIQKFRGEFEAHVRGKRSQNRRKS